MNSEHQKKLKKLLNLKEAADRLGVTPGVLLEWNEFNILKPTITTVGEIGYDESQINQFLAIRKSLDIDKNTNGIPQKMVLSDAISPRMQSPIDDSGDSISEIKETGNGAVQSRFISKSVPTLLVFSLILLFAFSTVAAFKILKTVPDNYDLVHKGNTVRDQALSIRVMPSASESKSNANSENLHNEVILGENKTGINALTGVLGQNTAGTDEHQATEAALLQESRELGQGDSDIVQTYASVGEPGREDLTIDESGNIRGELGGDTLATAIGGLNGVLAGNSFNRSDNDSMGQLALLTVTGLGAVFLFRKKLFYAVSKPSSQPAIDPITKKDYSTPRKILELDQKMDGTVILNFQGKEYKVCRPELYSESDHLIQRLLELTRPDIKEIDYQSLDDEGIELSTPLSKLVTRLGFVGIKRELFFPRTSKDRVLFRRYITEDDLISMKLEIGQLSADLSGTS